MARRASVPLVLFSALLAAATDMPRFEDYPASTDRHGPAAPVKLVTRSERMFQTLLTEAGKKPPDFAGHYKFDIWGCGSECAASAVVDLQSGDVYAPPLAKKVEGWGHWISCVSMFEGTGFEYHVNSRLMITRCGSNFDKDGKNHPDVYYLLWDGAGFKELLHVRAKR